MFVVRASNQRALYTPAVPNITITEWSVRQSFCFDVRKFIANFEFSVYQWKLWLRSIVSWRIYGYGCVCVLFLGYAWALSPSTTRQNLKSWKYFWPTSNVCVDQNFIVQSNLFDSTIMSFRFLFRVSTTTYPHTHTHDTVQNTPF